IGLLGDFCLCLTLNLVFNGFMTGEAILFILRQILIIYHIVTPFNAIWFTPIDETTDQLAPQIARLPKLTRGSGTTLRQFGLRATRATPVVPRAKCLSKPR